MYSIQALDTPRRTKADIYAYLPICDLMRDAPMMFSKFATLLKPYCGADDRISDFVVALCAAIMECPRDKNDLKKDEVDEYNPMSKLSISSLENHYSGRSPISQKNAAKLLKHLDKTKFSEYVNELSLDALTALGDDLCKVGYAVSGNEIGEVCADIFAVILEDLAKGTSKLYVTKTKKAANHKDASQQCDSDKPGKTNNINAHISMHNATKERKKGNITIALQHLTNAEQEYRREKNYLQLAHVLTCMSILETILEYNSLKARDYSTEATALYIASSDKFDQRILLNMGVVESRRGQFEAARQYYSLAEKVSEEKHDKPVLANAYRLRGIMEGKKGQGGLEMAKYYISKAQDIFIQTEDVVRQGKCYQAFGDLEREHDNYEAALGFYKEAWSIFECVDDPKGIGSIMGELCRIYAHIGNEAESLKWMERIKAYSNKTEFVKNYTDRCVSQALELLQSAKANSAN